MPSSVADYVGSGTEYVYDENYSVQENAEAAGATIVMEDWELGSKMGSYGGQVAGWIGAAAGLVMGLIDAAAQRTALDAEATDDAEWRAALEADLDKTMNLRANIQRQMIALMAPTERMLAERQIAFGYQARAQGLTGAQAVAAQLKAEQMYRTEIGSRLPEILIKAQQNAQGQMLAELKAIEQKYGIKLDEERVDLYREQQNAAAWSALAKGIVSTATTAGQMIQMFAESSNDLGGDAIGGDAIERPSTATDEPIDTGVPDDMLNDDFSDLEDL